MKTKILIRKYIIYGLIGICFEVFFTGLISLVNNDLTMEGTSYIWMFFIYGLAIFIEPIHNKIRSQNIIIRGIIYMILIYIVELLSGLALRQLIGKCPWNYTDRGAINSIITLSLAPIWFSLGLFYERVHDYLDKASFV